MSETTSPVVRLLLPRGLNPPVRLTASRIAKLVPRAKPYDQRDTEVSGLLVRVQPSGRKVFYLSRRIGRGRGAAQRFIKLGSTADLTLADARARALRLVADMVAGVDPKAETPGATKLGDLIDLYDRRLEAREAVKRSDVVSSLRTNLRGLQGRPVGELTRQHVVAVMDRLEAAGKPGAAEYLRKSAVALLNWAVNAGHLHASPMAGYRREKSTKAEGLRTAPRLTLRTPGRLAAFWAAADNAASDIFRDLIRFLLLTGQRRAETAAMRWCDLHMEGWTHSADEVFSGPLWAIPASATKMGRAHVVPLGSLSLQLLEAQERYADCDLVFPGRNLKPISGWSQLLRPIRQAEGMAQLTPHALRRSFRSVLGELGVAEPVAETMIAHKRQGLVALYDHATLWDARRTAQETWEARLAELVG